VVGHLQLESSTSPPRAPMAPAWIHWLLPLDYEAGPLSFQRWRVFGVRLLEQNSVLSNDDDN
jgi:hypothetical protein